MNKIVFKRKLNTKVVKCTTKIIKFTMINNSIIKQNHVELSYNLIYLTIRVHPLISHFNYMLL